MLLIHPLLQETITAVGRICCDSEGRLNASSIMLEGSLDVCDGLRTVVDVSNVEHFSLFPGQVWRQCPCATFLFLFCICPVWGGGDLMTGYLCLDYPLQASDETLALLCNGWADRGD